MGRHERLVARKRDFPHRAKLALWLREQKTRVGLSYRELGRRVYTHPGVLARAASGNVMPTWNTVEAYVHGCGADLTRAHRLWRRARAEQHEPDKWVPAPRLRPEYLKDFRGLQLGMIALRRECGQPTLRELEKIAAAQGNRLPRSTLGAVLRGRAIPSESLMLAFVEACATQRRRYVRVELWMAAWKRAERDRQRRRYRPLSFSNAEAMLEAGRDAVASSVTRGVRDLLDRHVRNGLSAEELEQIVGWAASDWREQQGEVAYDSLLWHYELMGA